MPPMDADAPTADAHERTAPRRVGRALHALWTALRLAVLLWLIGEAVSDSKKQQLTTSHSSVYN
jgi:hypothetical protein